MGFNAAVLDVQLKPTMTLGKSTRVEAAYAATSRTCASSHILAALSEMNILLGALPIIRLIWIFMRLDVTTSATRSSCRAY